MAQHRFKHEIVLLKWHCWKQGRCSNWSLGTLAVSPWLATRAREWFEDFKTGKIGQHQRDQRFSEAGHVLGQNRNSWSAFQGQPVSKVLMEERRVMPDHFTV